MIILEFFIFLILAFLYFTVIPYHLLKKFELNFWERIFLGSSIGYVLITLTFFVLLLLKVPFLIYLVPIVSLVLLVKNFREFNVKIKSNILKLLSLVLLFGIGIFGQLLVIAPSGTLQNGNLVFWSSHAHDASWHIALMNQIEKGFPINNPSFANERLVNYHFFSDIAPVIFTKYFHFSALDLYFRFFPFVFSLLLGGLAYLLIKRVTRRYSAGVFSVIFVYFAGSFGYIATWINSHTIGGESIFWATQIQSSIGNPPQIISDIIVLAILFFLYLYFQKKSLGIFIILIPLIASLAVFKIYASIVTLSALVIIGFWQFIKTKDSKLAVLAFISGIFSLCLYLPFSRDSAGFLIFEPWWYIRTMIVSDSRLNWLDLELKRQFYLNKGGFRGYARVIEYEFIGFLIFFVGNLGTRIFGLLQSRKLMKTLFRDTFWQIIILISLVSFVLPLLFLQKGVASNTSQFLQYFLLMFGLLASVSLTNILDRIKNYNFKIVFVLVIIVFSLPTQIGLLYEFYKRPPFSKISESEIQALNYLKNNTPQDSVIGTPNYNQYLDLKDTTPNIWDWSDTSYVSAFSDRQTFFSDEEQIDIMGYDFLSRKKILNEIFQNESPQKIINILKVNGINYIYYPKKSAQLIGEFNAETTSKVFENNEVIIWKVN